jgi:hypothetical protein
MEKSFNLGPQNKVAEYIKRYQSGESIESFGEIPESWKKEILASNTNENIPAGVVESTGIEEIKSALAAVSEDNYLFTHITAPDVAEKIYNSNFVYSLGTGLTGTMTFIGANGALGQIEKIFGGESPHRNLTGMFIIAIPKNLLPTPGPDTKINGEVIENFLIENYSSMQKGEIPKEFNFGYLKDQTLYHKK